MRIKFTGRWNKQSLKNAICEAIEELQFYDIEFLSGVNLYFHGENINFEKIEIKSENDAPIMFIYDNNIPVIKPRKKKKRKAPVISLADFKINKQQKDKL
ncbi:hypothetical protein QE197_21680 (plasmid) [Arsenophonus nasoniae]|uniref:Uncharacterized protein n=1 Tax=Arsenophonus nasoniae TaxID=638 RepID=A0A4P7L0G7_9GAMM|nr:hypothetical protein [Arsenophonus nasoniae]QBY46125.1 hypothetical protein ArsFIN_47360 [Arsenophonus nasoniae]WGM03681.1 hypothetical protein QE210_19530 [Arsenophonus nasoniae]WGM08190.1 hypothetical protein QE258_23285 [Arsenophonus nasoniae]WGM08865.1 hypothetical protein QE258_26260 [Arsenophonus nasoniae]WGM13040.1 hypothetical protein QE197_21680 [Arsenophonus nasoniae]